MQQPHDPLRLLSLSVPALSINTAAANAAAINEAVTQEAFSHLATPPPDPDDHSAAAAPFGSARLVLAPSPSPSGGDFLYFEKSDPDPNSATSAATAAYPSSPPPSRQREHAQPQSQSQHSQDTHAPPNHFRLPQQRLALDMLNINPSYANSSNNSLLHQRPPNYPSPSSALSSADQQRFPPLSAMLAAEQQQQSNARYARYPFSSPTDDRRLSDMSDSYPKHHHQQYASPQSLPNTTSSYAAPSYTLHRIARSNSFDDYPKDSPVHPARDDRAFDPYSPIQSSFSSSPHASSYLLHHHGSRPYTNTATTTTTTNSNLAYPLYPSAEDMSYDSRPHSSSGESNSPSYAYSHPNASNPGAVGIPPNLDPAYGNANDASKTYSFVSLPGNTVRKRPRRRYDEIERLYSCNYPGCTKAYGTLNHLNAHVNMQKHGQKRHPNGELTLTFLVKSFSSISHFPPIPPFNFILSELTRR